jgi:Xaa-Pro aminopeptidase
VQRNKGFLKEKTGDMDNKTHRNRLKGIREGMAKSKVDCLILTKPANVTYVTGFMGDDSWAIILPRGVILVTDSRYIEQAKQECPGSPECRIVERKDAMAKAVTELLKSRSGIKIAIENSSSIAALESLRKHLKRQVGTTENVVETVRRKKDANEIATIRAAGKIAARAFKDMLRQIRTGMTENELAGILDLEIRKLGGKNSFETIAAFGSNASRPHHRPTNRKLRKNDTILIDFGVQHNGYCCDITRCLTRGGSNRLYKRASAAVEEAGKAALKIVRAGVDARQVDAAARNVIRKAGLPVYGHGTGHGLGLEVHELPVVSNKSQATLLAGDVITIEPGIYIPGKLGVRLEDDVLVTGNGYVLLSEC